MRIVTVAIAAAALAGVVYGSASGQQKDTDLRRIDCSRMTVFALKSGSSADDVCRNYGGVAKIGATPSETGLVILVRNQPMGGFNGQTTTVR